jgi:hypothetical protein
MAASDEMIDRIVQGVLEQIRHADIAPSTSNGKPPVDGSPLQIRGPVSSEVIPNAQGTIDLPDDVITAALLEARPPNFQTLVIGMKSVLTPSAREFLARRKIEWKRATCHSRSKSPSSTWLAIVVRSTPAVVGGLDASAKESGAAWNRELAGCDREASARGIGAVCRGEANGVVIFTGKPEAVACRANRHARVRAVAVATAPRAKELRAEMGVNLFAVDPAQKSAFELRRLLREIAAGGAAFAPSDWNE